MMEQQERVSPGFHFLPACTTTAESPSKLKIVQCNLAIVNYTINRQNRRASDDPQDAQRDGQTRKATCSVSHISLFLCLTAYSRTDILSSHHSLRHSPWQVPARLSCIIILVTNGSRDLLRTHHVATDLLKSMGRSQHGCLIPFPAYQHHADW
jgi:hypothetical protein